MCIYLKRLIRASRCSRDSRGDKTLRFKTALLEATNTDDSGLKTCDFSDTHMNFKNSWLEATDNDDSGVKTCDFSDTHMNFKNSWLEATDNDDSSLEACCFSTYLNIPRLGPQLGFYLAATLKTLLSASVLKTDRLTHEHQGLF